MKRVLFFVVTAVMSMCLSGCGTAGREIQMKSQSERAGVFSEVKADEPVPKSFVDMVIHASIKTHAEGHYPLEPKEQFHGNPEYPFLMNIDGQAVIWKVDGSMDDTPLYDENGKRRTEPEAGKGVKYILDKRIMIAPGPHKIFFGLLAEGFSKEFEVALEEGKPYILTFTPVYQYAIFPYRIPSFLEGIKDYEGFLNGSPVQ